MNDYTNTARIAETKMGSRLSNAIAVNLKNLTVEVFAFGISENDIDLAVLIDDDISPLFIVETIAVLLLDLSLKEGRLVTCTPIHRSKYARADTAFVKNVIFARDDYAET